MVFRNLGKSLPLVPFQYGLKGNVHRWTPVHSRCLAISSINKVNEGDKRFWTQKCSSSEEIESLGKRLAPWLHNGDVLLLRGDLGAGKTTLSRGIIRGIFENDDLLVTSPSYLLDNSYERHEDGLSIHHMDLYRLPKGCDLSILNIPNIFSTSLCIIEWPDRLGPEVMPKDYLDIELRIKGDESELRTISLTPTSDRWKAMLSEAITST